LAPKCGAISGRDYTGVFTSRLVRFKLGMMHSHVLDAPPPLSHTVPVDPDTRCWCTASMKDAQYRVPCTVVPGSIHVETEAKRTLKTSQKISLPTLCYKQSHANSDCPVHRASAPDSAEAIRDAQVPGPNTRGQSSNQTTNHPQWRHEAMNLAAMLRASTAFTRLSWP